MGLSATSDVALDFLEALYAFAEEPSRWLDVIEAIEKLPPHTDVQPDGTRLQAHAERAAALAQKLNASRGAAPSDSWDALLLSANGEVRRSCGDAAGRLRPYLTAPLRPFHRPVFLNALKAAFDTALAQALSGKHGGVAHLTLSDEKVGRLFAIVLSRPAFPRELSAALGLSHIGAEPLIAVALVGEAHPAPTLREGLGLSPAEWRLAEQLKQGVAVGDAALALGISVHTARTQIKSIFAKLGVSRQSELVHRLTFAERVGISGDGGTPAPSHDAPARRFMTLADGRRLAYRIFGQPQGVPVIAFNQWFAASLLPFAATEALKASRLRLIVADRPGIGQSSPLSPYSFEGPARDAMELADHLRLDRFGLMGIAPGAPFAIAAASVLGERVTKLALVAPRVLPVDRQKPGGALHRNLAGLARQKWLIRSVTASLRSAMSPQFAQSVVRYISTQSEPDIAAVENPEVVRAYLAAGFDAFETTGEGFADELTLFSDDRFPRAEALRCPIRVWHGARDNVNPPETSLTVFGQHPAAEVTIIPHLATIFDVQAYRDVFDWLASGR